MRAGNFHVFGQANLTGASLALYQHTWERVLGGMPSQLDVRYVYLRASVDTIVERMVKRGREAESKVPRDYLELLHGKHEAWLDRPHKKGWCAIDASRDPDAVWQSLCQTLKLWFDEAGEAFKEQRKEPVSTSDLERNLTVMIRCAQVASEALDLESPNGLAKERGKTEIS